MLNMKKNFPNTLENLNRQLRIGDVISTLMAQSLKLMDIVNENQKRVNDIKKEQEQLQLYIDNSTDEIEEYGDTNQGLGTWNGHEYVPNK